MTGYPVLKRVVQAPPPVPPAGTLVGIFPFPKKEAHGSLLYCTVQIFAVVRREPCRPSWHIVNSSGIEPRTAVSHSQWPPNTTYIYLFPRS